MKSIFYQTFFSLAIACLFGFTFIFSQSLSVLWKPADVDTFDLVLKEGDNYRSLISRIEQAGYEGVEWPLRLYSKITGLDRQVKRGRYRMGPDWSPAQVVEQAALAPNAPLRFTIKPGTTLRELGQSLVATNLVESATAWLATASSENVHRQLSVPSYEGLLAPETYFLEEETKPEALLERMHQEWRRFAESVAGTSDLDARMKTGLSLYDTTILASIIEKEAASEIDMATVSSVFHNRIRKNWPLGSAVTLRYALPDYEGKDQFLPVGHATPYNTTRKPGLPPTPICTPSRAALEAALAPPTTPYFFFVADGDGGLIFNKDYDAHRRSVSDYRRKIKEE